MNDYMDTPQTYGQFKQRIDKNKINEFYKRFAPKNIEKPKAKKTQTINDEINPYVKDISKSLEEFNQFFILNVNKNDKVNISEIKDKFNILMTNIEEYNSKIDSWYDDKFYEDKQKLYDSIKLFDTIAKNYAENNFIIII